MLYARRRLTDIGIWAIEGIFIFNIYKNDILLTLSLQLVILILVLLLWA